MEHVLVRIGLIGGMAVDAHTVYLGIHQHGFLFKSGETALIESHLAVNLITGGNTAIGDAPFAEWIVADVDGEIAIGCPLPIFFGIHRYRELSALVLFQQLVPFVDVEVGKSTVGMEFTALDSFHGHIHCRHLVVGHGKVQGGDIGRDGDLGIVRIDFRQMVCRHDILWS